MRSNSIRASGPFTFLAAALCLCVAASLAADSPMRELAWQGVEGAIAYRFEVVSLENLAFVDALVREPVARFPLPVGEYLYRVTVYDSFFHPADTSGWAPLSIRYPEPPVVFGLAEPAGWTPERAGLFALSIDAEWLGEGVKVSLDGPEASYGALSLTESEEGAVAVFDLSYVEPGVYDLVIVNDKERETRVRAVVSVDENGVATILVGDLGPEQQQAKAKGKEIPVRPAWDRARAERAGEPDPMEGAIVGKTVYDLPASPSTPGARVYDPVTGELVVSPDSIEVALTGTADATDASATDASATDASATDASATDASATDASATDAAVVVAELQFERYWESKETRQMLYGSFLRWSWYYDSGLLPATPYVALDPARAWFGLGPEPWYWDPGQGFAPDGVSAPDASVDDDSSWEWLSDVPYYFLATDDPDLSGIGE